MKNIVKSISDRANKYAEYLLIFLIASISLLIFIQVVCRYVFNYSLYWSEELARYILIWITFLGAAVGFKRKAHMGIDFLYKSVNPRTRYVFTLLSDIFILILSFIMAVYGTLLAVFVRFQLSAALLIPMTLPYFSLALGGVLIFIHSASFFMEDIGVKEGREE